jgi:hypothetical protein
MFTIFGILTFLTFPGQSDGDVINACKNDHSGVLRVVDDVTECRGSETPLSWNTEGPQGPQGEQGPPGPNGFDVNRLYVVTCEYSVECQCDDRGGRNFISGTVDCPLREDTSTQTYLHVTSYFEETEIFEAVCTSAQYEPPFSSYHTPESIKLICYDDSE